MAARDHTPMAIRRAQHLARPGSHFNDFDRLGVFVVQQNRVTLALAEQEALAPLTHADHDRKHRTPHLGQHVFLIGGAIGCRLHLEYAEFAPPLELYREDVFRQTQTLLEFAETTYVIESVTDDHQHPTITNSLKRAGHGTFALC